MGCSGDRRQAVANARRDRSVLVGEAPGQWVVLHGPADDEASAVEVKDDRSVCASIRRRGGQGPVNPHGDTVAQVDERTALRSARAADAAIARMQANLHYDDWIVQNTTADSLAHFARQRPELAAWLVPELRTLTTSRHKSVRGRAAKLLASLGAP